MQPSDRFVFSKYFLPLRLQLAPDTPLLTFYQREAIRRFVERPNEATRAALEDKRVKAALQHYNIPVTDGPPRPVAGDTEVVIRPGKMGGTTAPGAPSPSTPSTPATVAEDLLALLQSPIGHLFLDRTRIRPSGFAVGEHLYTLSLAPGEEVVLEQKTFSKREMTFEEQTEEEMQRDLELSSTLSTELQEGAERQRNRTNSSGLTAGASVGGNVQGVDVSANLSYTNNVTEASNETRKRSVKDNTTTTQRVAAKYRAAHKVSFKVSTTTGFESTSKRVVKNPNRFRPINLHYFKIMQVLDIMQQRHGVRLCWAPTIKDPGFDLYERIRLGRAAILQKAEEIALPPRPVEPVPPNHPPVWSSSAPTEANRWGVMCDMRYDYDIEIPIPTGYVWDGDATAVRDSLAVALTNINRSHNEYVVASPWVVGDKLIAKVHVGVDWKWPIGGCGTIYLTVSGRFLADPATQDPAYREAYAQWLQAVAEWEAQVSAARDAAREQARKQADEWEQQLLRDLNPLGELMARVISHEFAPTTRDDVWEVELWQHVFDWNAASFVLYPGWWSDLSPRDPQKPPNDFVNASWAKLYLPIKIGFERMALRWIFDRQVQNPLPDDMEAEFTRLETELSAYRTANFGNAEETATQPAPECDRWDERVLCLARWTELLPTDGTHVEVVQSATSAADPFSVDEVTALRELQAATVDSTLQDIELKKKAASGMKKEVTADIRINVDGPRE
jgi:hypothetical protein